MRLIGVAIAVCLCVMPAVADARSPALQYVLNTAHGARALQRDEAAFVNAWNTSAAHDYAIAVTFYQQLEDLQYSAARQASNPLSRAYLPENEVWLIVTTLPEAVQSLEEDVEYSFLRSELNASIGTFKQDIATYNTNVRQLWRLAGVANPPVLEP